MEASIKIPYHTKREAITVAEALSPDNLKVPKGLTVETKVKGRNVVTVIRCKRGLKTMISTIDDVLMCVQAAEEALEVVKRG
jgi:hypothetical protein